MFRGLSFCCDLTRAKQTGVYHPEGDSKPLMTTPLREAWTSIIRPEDYEAHMAAVGQAQANAKLVAEYFQQLLLEAGATVLFMGAGTGQMFDFVSPEFLLPFQTTFADIHPGYLKWLDQRLKSAEGLRYATIVDDVERTALSGKFDLVLAVLLLEHVAWRKAVGVMCALANKRVFVVTQENPRELATALTPNSHIPGSMNIFSKVHPALIPRQELIDEFRSHGFDRAYSADRSVADGKKMAAIGLIKGR
jgi:Methyltransferase domain